MSNHHFYLVRFYICEFSTHLVLNHEFCLPGGFVGVAAWAYNSSAFLKFELFPELP